MPRKLGQHFLSSEAILRQIAAAACGPHAERVIEIGPGRGALTRHLLELTDELHAIELDADLIEYLKKHFTSAPHLTIHPGDVLATDLSQWGPAIIAGNIPYYITSPIIERFLQLDQRFPRAVLLMQLEVAERLLATPGHREYGYLTVATQLFCDVRLLCKVPPGAFSPPPKVDSAAVVLERKAAVPANAAPFLKFVGQCFLHKRKTLRNNLRALYGEAATTIPEANFRAEQLDLARFLDLFARLVH